jgi:hypothetical protein
LVVLVVDPFVVSTTVKVWTPVFQWEFDAETVPP